MTDLAAAEGEAAAADASGPRIGSGKGALLAFVGSALLSLALTLLAVLAEAGSWWLVVAGAVTYALALLAWAGAWRRPLTAAAIVGASLVGLVAGYLVAVWAIGLLATGPGP